MIHHQSIFVSDCEKKQQMSIIYMKTNRKQLNSLRWLQIHVIPYVRGVWWIVFQLLFCWSFYTMSVIKLVIFCLWYASRDTLLLSLIRFTLRGFHCIFGEFVLSNQRITSFQWYQYNAQNVAVYLSYVQSHMIQFEPQFFLTHIVYLIHGTIRLLQCLGLTGLLFLSTSYFCVQ